jgi:heat shock protein HslJ
MIGKIVIFGSFLVLAQLQTCENLPENKISGIEGEWVLSKVFLSDAYDSPCGSEVKENVSITLNIQKEDNHYALSGRSAVNNYFGSLKTDKDDPSKIEIGSIGSTKMAGPPELMACETRHFDFLSNAKELTINSENQLLIGNFRNENSHPRDGGTYLVFEKAK